MARAATTARAQQAPAILAAARRRAARALAWSVLVMAAGSIAAVAFAVGAARHSAWRGTLRSTGRQATAHVGGVSVRTGHLHTQTADVDLVVAESAARVRLSSTEVGRYGAGTTIDVWYDPERPGRVATRWDVTNDGVADAAGFAAAVCGVVAACGALVARNRGVAIAVLRRGPARDANVTVWQRPFGRGVRTVVTLPDDDRPWTMLRGRGALRTGHTVLAGRGYWIVACPPAGGGPYLLRRSRTRWSARRWRLGSPS